MATLNLKSIATLVANQAAAVQANATQLIDFSTGSILRAVAQANAAVAMWLQGMILVVLQVSRLATSTGNDVDTFVNDYGLFRLGVQFSAGSVTFSRFTPTQSAFIPVGAQVQSADGTQTFNVIADLTNPAYNATLNGFIIAPGISSLTVLVNSANSGTAANVVANAVTRIITSISGVDFVNNTAPMVGGSNAETDAALKIRFVLYLASLSKATAGAVGFAVSSLQLGVQYTITQNQDYSGGTHFGYFYVVVDDGSGSPSSALLTEAFNAILPVAPLTITFNVFAPVVVTADVSGTIILATGFNPVTVKANVAAAWTTYIATLGLGNSLNYVTLGSIGQAVPGVVTIDNFLLDGSNVDIPGNPQNVIKPGTVSAN